MSYRSAIKESHRKHSELKSIVQFVSIGFRSAKRPGEYLPISQESHVILSNSRICTGTHVQVKVGTEN